MQSDGFVKYLLLQAINIYEMMIVIRAIISWFRVNPYNSLYRFLISVTEPFLMRIRKFLPQSGVDFSPIIAILLLSLLSRLIISI